MAEDIRREGDAVDRALSLLGEEHDYIATHVAVSPYRDGYIAALYASRLVVELARLRTGDPSGERLFAALEEVEGKEEEFVSSFRGGFRYGMSQARAFLQRVLEREGV